MEVLKKLANQAQGAVTGVVSGATDTVNKAGHESHAVLSNIHKNIGARLDATAPKPAQMPPSVQTPFKQTTPTAPADNEEEKKSQMPSFAQQPGGRRKHKKRSKTHKKGKKGGNGCHKSHKKRSKSHKKRGKKPKKHSKSHKKKKGGYKKSSKAHKKTKKVKRRGRRKGGCNVCGCRK